MAQAGFSAVISFFGTPAQLAPTFTLSHIFSPLMSAQFMPAGSVVLHSFGNRPYNILKEVTNEEDAQAGYNQ